MTGSADRSSQGETWRQLLITVAASALVGAASAWGTLNQLVDDTSDLEGDLRRHSQIDGHVFVLRQLPRLESKTMHHERRLDVIDRRVDSIERNRYTDADGERHHRFTNERIKIILKRLERLEEGHYPETHPGSGQEP